MVNLQLLKGKTALLNEQSKTIRAQIDILLDEASFVETDVFMASKNVLDDSFNMGEGVVTGFGTMDGNPVCIVAQNSEVMKGSMSKAQADKIINCINRAVRTNSTLVSIIDSAGARIGEGMLALEAYAAIIAKSFAIKNVITHIAIIDGYAIGHMSSYAMMADFVIMTNKGVLSATAPQPIIAGSKSNSKPVDVLGAKSHTENNANVSFKVADINGAKNIIIDVLKYIDESFTETDDDANRTSDILNTEINFKNLSSALFDDGKYLEIFNDFATDVATAFGSVNGINCGIVATNIKGNSKLNKGSIKKIKKFVNILNTYNLPLITLVDIDGVDTCLKGELNGFSMSMAKFIGAIADADITKIAVVVGKAIGFGYTSLVSKSIGFDYALAFENAEISAVTSEIAVTVISDVKEFKGTDPVAVRKELELKYTQQVSNAFESAKFGYIDNVIEPALIRPYIAQALIVNEI